MEKTIIRLKSGNCREISERTLRVVICTDCKRIVGEDNGNEIDQAIIWLNTQAHQGHDFETWNRKTNLSNPGIVLKGDLIH